MPPTREPQCSGENDEGTICMNAPVRMISENASPDAALLNDWHVVAFSKDVPPGKVVPATLLGEDLILWRDASGKVHVWKDLCIHRGARLSKGWIANDTVVCPYHGWRYDEERYGMVWASLGEPKHAVPTFPEWDDVSFRKFNTGPYFFKANGFRSVENFIDATHFPFVHGGLNGVEEAPDKLEDYKVFEDEMGISTSGIRVYQPYGDHRQVPVNAIYTYRVFRPLVAYFSKQV
jgi:phenylpropionate dioxygenase-like ring-hydroxylating dioxygenase large terminal subunit